MYPGHNGRLHRLAHGVDRDPGMGVIVLTPASWLAALKASASPGHILPGVMGGSVARGVGKDAN